MIKMKIATGTRNKGKIEAIRNGLSNYPEYADAEIKGVEADSGVKSQPIGLDEMIRGAKRRAEIAYASGADLGFGLESGIFPVPHTKSGYMGAAVCAIYDGKEFHLGLSSAFEYPKKMIQKVLDEGKEITDAALDLGFAEEKSFREDGGMIGILTRGVITRKKYSEQAVHTAMIHLLNKEHYTD